MKNFGPYQDPLIYTIKNDTLTLIVGPNGVGKTISMDAIPYTLYGITSKGARGDDVVNNKVGKNCHTWVNLSVDGKDYKVDRYHKYSKLGNTATLTTGGKIIAKGHREVVPMIESLITPRKLFMNTRMFGQKVKDFFTDLLDSERKEIFRMIIQLENYVKYYDEAKNSLSDIDKLINDINNTLQIKIGIRDSILFTINLQEEKQQIFCKQKQEDLYSIKESISPNMRLIIAWKVKVDELQKEDLNVAETIGRIGEIKIQLEQYEDRLQTKSQKVHDQKNAKVSELRSQASKQTSENSTKHRTCIQVINSQIQEQNQNSERLQAELFKIQNTFDIQIAKAEEGIMGSEITSRDLNAALLSKVRKCPTCLQDITEDSKEHILGEIKIEEGKIKELSAHLDSLLSKRKEQLLQAADSSEKVRENIEKLREKIRDIEAQERIDLKEVDVKLDSLIKKVESLATNLIEEIIKQEDAQRGELYKEEQELSEKKRVQDEMIAELHRSETNIATLNQTLEDLKTRLKETEAETFDRTELDEALNNLMEIDKTTKSIEEENTSLSGEAAVVSFWKIGFSSTGIPSMLIDDAIPFMNKTVAEYLEQISNGRYLVSFDTLDETKSGQFRDKISVKVLDTETKANSRVQLSGGQTRIIDIATILTLGDLQEEIQKIKFNILLFDEIFDSLDDENITYVSKVLRKLTKGKALFIISHRHVDQLDADDVYNF